MYKVLIVDDEHYVVTLIRHLIDWQQFGMEVVGEAADGMEALEKIHELEPEIVVVDVCMPEIDGITLIQRIRQLDQDIRFIVISGHKKFEYAKSAIQYNVEDYLLKPIDKEELETILKKLQVKLEEQRANAREQQQQDRRLTETTRQLREYFMSLLAEHRIKWPEESSQSLKERYHVNFADDLYKFVLLKLDTEEEQVSRGFVDESLRKVVSYLGEFAGSYQGEMLFSPGGSQIVCLLNYPPQRRQEVNRMPYQWKERLDPMFEKFGRIYITVVVGNEFSQCQETDAELIRTEQAMQAKVVLGCGRVYSVREFRGGEELPEEVLTAEQVELLQLYISGWQEEPLRDLLRGCFRRAGELTGQQSLILNQTAMQILKIFYQYLIENSLYQDSFEALEGEWNKRLGDCVSVAAMRSALINQMAAYREQYINGEHPGESRVIRLAKRYIAAHYQEDLTLEKVAAEVNLSRVYFSILFKRETGGNFQRYVSQYRVEIAKELLKQAQYSINEIAERSGFQDGRYFAKVFKKHVGLAPSEYRNRQADY